MPNNAIAPSKNNLASYDQLLKSVRGAIAAGKERALDVVEREKVRTAWEVGKLIQKHILLHKDRASYGQQVLKRLSSDIGISVTEIQYMLEFARANPIYRPAGKLSWGHHEALLRINEPEEREKLGRIAAREKWTRKTLRSEINKRKVAKEITVSAAPPEEPLVSVKGKLDTYRVITAKVGPWTGKTALDLGFSNYHRPLTGEFSFSEKEIVEIASSTSQKSAELPAMTAVKNATEADLFAYRAYVFDVTDADTLWMLVDLGFGFMTQQHLRLRGIDAPEITTREGQEAKRFVERELKKVSQVVISTTKSDKYDRYLADVFYEVNGKELFLNNRLLQAGLANRVEF